MHGMSTIVEAKSSNLQPYYCCSLTIWRPSILCPKLLLGLFLHTLKRTLREFLVDKEWVFFLLYGVVKERVMVG
jgi:hypothetical protein